MRVLSVSWNQEADSTKITLADDFNCGDKLFQLDVLNDTIGILTDLYSEILKKDYGKTYYLDKVHDINTIYP